MRLSNALRPPLLAISSRRQPSSSLIPHVDYLPPAEGNFLQSRINSLRRALWSTGDPSRIYTYYINFVNFFSPSSLPLELHQQVLRRCSLEPAVLRILAAKHLLEGRKPERPHMHEGRFQTIIGNIRALGPLPSLDDYHHVLKQFAAVGHFIGSLQVYQEIIHLGLTPEPKTIALFLQALAHRHSLPILKVYKPRLASQTRKILDSLLSDMRKYNISFNQPILELTLRVFKESVDEDGFDKLLKWAYGIDLSNPDCPPLEFLQGDSQSSKHVIIPFSTHALNTIIDTLGRFGDISKLVQAFEVLTQPLPQAGQYRFSSFDDDDDVSVEEPSPPEFAYPFAEPNTTTYNMLLRHIGKADHGVLARHYLIQVMRLDREVNWKLVQQIKAGVPLENIPAPRLSLNRRMFLSVFGHSNRWKNLALMRWLSTKLPKVQRNKKMDLDFYTEVRDRLDASLPSEETFSDAQSASTPLPSNDFQTLLPTMVKAQAAPSQTISVDFRNIGKAFDVDVNDLSTPQPQPVKNFDINLHIRILIQDIEEIAAFAKNLDFVLGRTHQRRKERLGRRVWGDKDVYLSDVHQRTRISRQRWQEIVGFRPRREFFPKPTPHSPHKKDVAPHLSPPQQQS